MKKASWGYCALVFNLSGKPAAHPEISDSFGQGGFGTEFEFGRTTLCEEGADATMNAPMDRESSMGQICFCIRRELSRFSTLLIFKSSRSPRG